LTPHPAETPLSDFITYEAVPTYEILRDSHALDNKKPLATARRAMARGWGIKLYLL